MKNFTLRKRVSDRVRLDETQAGDIGDMICESTVCFEDGQPRIVYLEKEDTKHILSTLAGNLSRLKFPKDDRTSGMPSTSRVFGFQPRITIRRDFCTAAMLNSEDPTLFNELVLAGQMAAVEYQQWAPVRYMAHLDKSLELSTDWRMMGTPFTSGIINLNSQLRYHFDAGNVKDCWSAMWVFKKGILGGHLNCPEYGVTFELKDNSLLLFDGQSILHGVTPIMRRSPDAYRISVVYYSLAGMWRCLTPEGELSRIRKVRTQREKKRAS